MKRIELIDKRKPRERHYLQEDGTFLVEYYNEDIYYKKNNKYEKIDNELLEESNEYINKNKLFKTKFKKNIHEGLVRIEKEDYYIEFNLLNNKMENKIKNNLNKNLVKYNDVLKNIDFEYKLLNSKIKESIILKNKDIDIENLQFEIKTNLILDIKENNIECKNDNEVIFKIDSPFMIDNKNIRNDNIKYLLETKNNKQILKLDVDYTWIKSKDRVFPITIDPTITVNNGDNSIQDTYISSYRANKNMNDSSKLSVGSYNSDNGIDTYRTLLKFELPNIPTASEIIDAKVVLIGYGAYSMIQNNEILEVHRITQDWNETTATWNNMSENYDERVEAIFVQEESYSYEGPDGTVSVPGENIINITNLVKQWYLDAPNYGIMIKASNENNLLTTVPMFYSKDNDYLDENNPRPSLVITYRNQNGYESYMEYVSQKIGVHSSHVNTYNGNLCINLLLSESSQCKLPFNFSLFYNTNDVILENDYGFTKGFKPNFYQTVKEVTIDEITYLEYLDEDGTIHYFKDGKEYYDEEGNILSLQEENKFYDEDNMNYVIQKTEEFFILKDDSESEEIFKIENGIGKLVEIKNKYGDNIKIEYDTNNRINKIIDSNNKEINITYSESLIEIISSLRTTKINIVNNKIISIDEILGTTTIEYNNNNIISKIKDVNGKSVGFDYYTNKPYKTKKITEYSINNTPGNYITLEYGFNSTSLIDKENKVTTLIFNNIGNLESMIGYKEKNNLKDSFGIKNTFGELFQDKNKLLTTSSPVRYIKNYLSNTGFENNTIYFVPEENISVLISNEESYSGYNSLKITSTELNKKVKYPIIVPKGKKYTFSAYIKNDIKCKLKLNYLNQENELVEEISDSIFESNEFNRYDVTINYPNEAATNLNIEIVLEEPGTIYIDNIQLEEGSVMNHYNYLENSDFQEGLLGWEVSNEDKFSVISLDDGVNALKITMDPNEETYIQKSFDIKGKPGDQYRLSFWYKNEGLNLKSDTFEEYNMGMVFFDYVLGEDDYGVGIEPISLPPNKDNWQFYTATYTAQDFDYNSLLLSFSQNMDANCMYITNICLYKEDGTIIYKYDQNGNIQNIKNHENKSSQYQYDNKEISKISYEGNFIKYEHDSDDLIRCIDVTGVNNIMTYDSNHNLEKTIITSKTKLIIEDGTYNIRKSNTEKYLNYLNNVLLCIDNSINTIWEIEKECTIEEIDYYHISHSILENKFITIENEAIKLANYSNDNSLFSFDKTDGEGYALCNKATNKYIAVRENDLVLSNYINDNSLEFFVEIPYEKLFLENTVEYTEDGINVKKATNEIFSDSYNEYQENGLLKNISKEHANAEYFYNAKNQLIRLNNNGREVCYEYNYNNKLSKIITADKEYTITYDEFLRQKSISLNNVLLLENIYDSINGKLIEIKIDNNSTIYEYDEFNRVISKSNGDKKYEYFYNDLNDLTKISTFNDKIEYKYDSHGNVIEYKCNDLVVKNVYDNNGNIIEKRYYINNILENKIIFNLNENEYINEVVVDNNKINIYYDELNRITNKKINNTYDIKYDYLDNGYRASYITNEISYNDNKYYYNFDKLLSLKSLYINNIIDKKYKYDIYNQLIETKDFKNNILEKYYYDDRGNIISTVRYNLDDYSYIDKNVYKYEDEILVDKLTKFNNTAIEYNSIGNPIKIGDNIELEWGPEKELVSYTKNNVKTEYEYDDTGNRKSKIQGTQINKYYYEGSDLVVESRNGDMIYYLRYVDGELFGFKYQENTYFYNKNFYGDIIAILDTNGEIVANYEYDSWGKILSIKDKFGNLITDENNPAIINPFRYREYYYDQESGMYNICKRYYDPELKRFINTDSQISDDFIGNNLYAYCGNNPVNCIDKKGKWIRFAVGALVGAVSAIYGTYQSAKKDKRKASSGEYLLSGIKGAIMGALSVTTMGLGARIVVTAIDNLIDNSAEEYINRKNDKKNNKKTKTIEESILTVSYSTCTDTAFDLITSSIGSKMLGEINNTKPKKLFYAFIDKTALKTYASQIINSFDTPLKNTVTKLINRIPEATYNSEGLEQRGLYKIEPLQRYDKNDNWKIPTKLPIN